MSEKPMMGQIFYDEAGDRTVIGYEHSSQKEIERLNDELTCSSEAYQSLLEKTRAFADLFVADNGSDRTLSVEDVDMVELTHRYADLELSAEGGAA